MTTRWHTIQPDVKSNRYKSQNSNSSRSSRQSIGALDATAIQHNLLTSFNDRNLCANPVQFLMACKCCGAIFEVKKTWAVLYCGLTFQSSSSLWTLLSVGVIKYTPEMDRSGSRFFSMFSTTAASDQEKWMKLQVPMISSNTLFMSAANSNEAAGFTHTRCHSREFLISGRHET